MKHTKKSWIIPVNLEIELRIFVFFQKYERKCWQKRKILSGQYIEKRLDHAKQSRTDASIKITLKVSGATGFLIENRIADKITKVFGRLPQITSKIVANEKKLDREISKERYIAI